MIPETCTRSGSELLRVLNTKQKLSTLLLRRHLSLLYFIQFTSLLDFCNLLERWESLHQL